MFAELKNLKHRIATQLCKRGILQAAEDKVFLFFTRKIYPEINLGRHYNKQQLSF